MFPKLKTKVLFLPLAIATLLVVIVGNPNPATAREWTLKIDGKVQKVEAKIVNFDGTNVLLEADNGVRKAFPITDLTDKDLAYVKNIVLTKQAKQQEKLNLKKLQQARLQNQLLFRDIWEVELYTADGRFFRRQYLARNNREAAYQARVQFPNARIGGERKIRREGSFQL